MISEKEKKIYISLIALTKGIKYGVTDNAIVKYAFDLHDWDLISKIIDNNFKSFIYLLKLCLKYGYLKKFESIVSNVNFSKSPDSIKYLLLECAKYKRTKQLNQLIKKYGSNIDFENIEFVKYLISNSNWTTLELLDQYINWLKLEEKIKLYYNSSSEILFYISFYENDYSLRKFIQTVSNRVFLEKFKKL